MSDVNERYNSITEYLIMMLTCVITFNKSNMNCNFIKEHADNFPLRTIFIRMSSRRFI